MLNKKQIEKLMTTACKLRVNDMIEIESFRPCVNDDALNLRVAFSSYKYDSRIKNFSIIDKNINDGNLTRERLIESIREAIDEYINAVQEDMITLFNKAL